MTSPVRIWWHGTNAESAHAIAKHGFRGGTYFAENLQDALEFGGPYVFEVALHHRPVTENNWQMRVDEAVPPEQIVRLTRYKKRVVEDYPGRRRAVFEANQ